ncbi:hypothetical protein BH24ACT1_BH24ACT1_07050 [soil metagenome]
MGAVEWSGHLGRTGARPDQVVRWPCRSSPGGVPARPDVRVGAAGQESARRATGRLAVAGWARPPRESAWPVPSRWVTPAWGEKARLAQDAPSAAVGMVEVAAERARRRSGRAAALRRRPYAGRGRPGPPRCSTNGYAHRCPAPRTGRGSLCWRARALDRARRPGSWMPSCYLNPFISLVTPLSGVSSSSHTLIFSRRPAIDSEGTDPRSARSKARRRWA